MRFSLFSWAILALLTCSNGLLASEPRFSGISPGGVQRGQQQVFTLRGERLDDAEEILFYDDGLSVVKLEPINAKRLKVTLKASDDCRLGEHTIQVRTRSGISDFRILQVEAYAAVTETEPNNDRSTAQLIRPKKYSGDFPKGVGAVVEGVMLDEDADWFRVAGRRGQRLSIEVVGMRLGEYCDTTLTLFDPAGEELASCDDTPLTGQDPWLSLNLPANGEYLLRLTDAAGRGGKNCNYRLHIGNFPRPAVASPAIVKAQQQTQLTFHGDGHGPFKQSLTLSADDIYQGGMLISDSLGTAPSPVPMTVEEFSSMPENEPNNNLKSATQLPPLPCAIHGVMDWDGDIDHYSFEAKKGQVLLFETFGRRIGSPIDTTIVLKHPNGKRLATNTDQNGSDSFIRATIPADGIYFITVQDLLRRSGSRYRYELTATPVRPSFSLGVQQIARYSQVGQFAAVHQGNRVALLFTAQRKDLNAAINLQMLDPAHGITMTARPMREGTNSIPVVFEASAAPSADESEPEVDDEVEQSTRSSDEKKRRKKRKRKSKRRDEVEDGLIEKSETNGGLVRLKGWAQQESETKVEGGFLNRGELVRVQPNNSILKYAEVDQLAVAVLEPAPIRLELQPLTGPLAQNGRLKLKVVIHRDPGFEKDVTLKIPFRSPGVNATGQVVAKADQDQIEYEISANAQAMLGVWPVCVTGRTNHNGPIVVSTKMEELEVVERYLEIDSRLAKGITGEKVKVKCDVELLNDFRGQATAKLIGLPLHSSAAPVEFDANDESFTVVVKTEPKFASGKNHSVICQVTIQQEGHPVVFRAGNVVFRTSPAVAGKGAE